MANFVITSSANSILVEIDDKKAPFSSSEIHPYTANGAGDTVYLYDTTGIFKAIGFKILAMPQLSRDRIPIVLGVDTINIDGVTSFADADSLLTALQGVFFLARSPAIPDNQTVDVFANLPDATANNGQYWIVDQPTGTWILGTRREAGVYKAVAGAWSYRGADVPYYLQDDRFTIKDSSDPSKQLGFQVDNIGTGQRRIATWQDKDIVVADANVTVQGQNSITGGGDLSTNRILQLVNDLLNPTGASVYGANPAAVKGWHQVTALVSNNAGQIKLNWSLANRPVSTPGTVADTSKNIPLNNNYTVSADPTTKYPYLANTAIGGQNVLDPATLFLRELKAGQSIIFRIKAGYLNKGNGQNGNAELIISNPNGASTFSSAKSIPTPDGRATLEEEIDFTVIADGLSLDPLYGYEFSGETTFNDGNFQFFIDEITAFYIPTEIFNKTP